ncbi:MAG: argininosuccinate lyase [Acidimicrobiales bacterium]|nr:argininosuccinate lyase [Acidimicrobiales bacterium]HLV91244.1 argininosuccinate lyase [Acidimicrobiia bacterium]
MTLWGGRFADGPDATLWAFTTDDSDRRLLEVDIRGSIAHAMMLGATGIIGEDESADLVNALERLLADARDGTFEFAEGDEDVHSAVERRLGELVGPLAGKLHTGRSRNDQIATDLRLYLIEAGRERISRIHALVGQLVEMAERHLEVVIPTYTHLQQAQTTVLGDHLCAYAWMLLRDVGRFTDCLARVSESPLGAGASAGSSLPLDRKATAEALGFDRVMSNTLDAVASRDFVAEYAFSATQTMLHLSRLAEEIVLWTTSEFGWARLADSVATGSSAMPHKKNPDIAELVRGRSATAVGAITAIAGLQKGLPLTYNRDLQEDKRIIFSVDDILAGSLDAMGVLLAGLTFDPPTPRAETTSLDLADVLVGRGVPFREAHEIVGRVVRKLEEEGRAFSEVTDGDLASVDDRFQPGDAAVADPTESVRRRAVTERVREQIGEIRARLSP